MIHEQDTHFEMAVESRGALTEQQHQEVTDARKQRAAAGNHMASLQSIAVNLVV
jgi:hypothetical protein